jgi:hypothetical protein
MAEFLRHEMDTNHMKVYFWINRSSHQENKPLQEM